MTHNQWRNTERALISESFELRATNSNCRDLNEDFAIERLWLIDIE
jgi:hypothetical protein